MSETTIVTPPVAGASVHTLMTGAAVAIGSALVGNLVVFLAGNAGAPIRVVTGWEPDGADLGFGSVVAATVCLSLLGTLALGVFDRLWNDGFRRWVALAAIVTVLSVPPVLRLDIDAGSKVALSVMHLVVGAAVIGGHAYARRRELVI